MKKTALFFFALMLACSPVLAAGIAVGTAVGFPTIKVGIGDNMAIDLGAVYTAPNGATATTAYAAKVTLNLAKAGDVQTDVGAFYTSNGATTATTAIGLTYGVSTMVASNLSIGLDFMAVSSSLGGTALATVVPGIALKGAYYL